MPARPAISAACNLETIPPEPIPDPEVTPAIARVKANDPAGAHAPLAQAARALVARGAAAVVLGCTEIPLGIAAGPALPFPVCDTIDALVRAAILARGPVLTEA